MKLLITIEIIENHQNGEAPERQTIFSKLTTVRTGSNTKPEHSESETLETTSKPVFKPITCIRQGCETVFTPYREDNLHCSKRCYHLDYYEKHKNDKIEKHPNKKSSPKKPFDDHLTKQKEKLSELKKKYPVKEDKRPEIQRELSV
jgi:hypothetical protein